MGSSSWSCVSFQKWDEVEVDLFVEMDCYRISEPFVGRGYCMVLQNKHSICHI